MDTGNARGLITVRCDTSLLEAISAYAERVNATRPQWQHVTLSAAVRELISNALEHDRSTRAEKPAAVELERAIAAKKVKASIRRKSARERDKRNRGAR
jgi:anti-sigma regulatory factor (Ser/Thr protein kinase)